MRIVRLPLLAATLLITTAPTTSGQILEDVFERVHTAVVTIRTAEHGVRGNPDPAFGFTVKVGSGVLISERGEVVTAAHVVQLADRIEVEFVDGTVLTASILASEPGPDLALLQLDGPAPAAAVVGSLGDSDEVRVGSRVFIIGAALDMSHTLTVGHVSARRKDESFLGTMRSFEHFQTDAAINRGNSGGPMFDLRGEVVGIVCHLVSAPEGSGGFGFVVTSNEVSERLIRHRGVWLGFDTLPLGEELARALNVPEGRAGMLVQRVARSSPAESLGLRGGSIPVMIDGRQVLLGGDVILAVLGRPVGLPGQVDAAVQALRELPPEGELRMTVLRAGVFVELAAPLAR